MAKNSITSLPSEEIYQYLNGCCNILSLLLRYAMTSKENHGHRDYYRRCLGNIHSNLEEKVLWRTRWEQDANLGKINMAGAAMFCSTAGLVLKSLSVEQNKFAEFRRHSLNAVVCN